MAAVRHTWAPSRTTPGEWHHWIVTITPTMTGWVSNVLGVAYERHDEHGHITNQVDSDADAVAPWYLDRFAMERYKTQRAFGWDGTNHEAVPVLARGTR